MERHSWIADFIEMADAVSRKWAANVNGGRVTLALILLTAILGAIYRAASSIPGGLPLWGAISKSLVTYVGVCAGLWLVVSLFAALVQAWGEQSHSLRLATADLAANEPNLVVLAGDNYLGRLTTTILAG
jgi:hypothetical protein